MYASTTDCANLFLTILDYSKYSVSLSIISAIICLPAIRKARQNMRCRALRTHVCMLPLYRDYFLNYFL